MKLKIKVPLNIGVLLFFFICLSGIQVILTSSVSLREVITEEIRIQNKANSELIYEKLQVDLVSLQNLAYTNEIMSMNWEIIQPYLIPYIQRNNISNMALVNLNGEAVYVLNDERANVVGRNYFNKAMSGQSFIEVVFSRISNNLVMLFITPVYNDGRVAGALLMRKNTEEVLSRIVNDLQVSWDTALNYLVSLESSIIYHENSEYTRAQFNIINDGGSWGEMVAEAVSAREGAIIYNYHGVTRLSVYSQVPEYEWILVTSVNKGEIDALVRKDIPRSALLGVLMALVGLIPVIIFSRKITKPISQIDDIMKHLGYGDLTQEIQINSKDEYGNLSDNINKTINGLKILVKNIKNKVHDLQATGEELSSNMNEAAAAVNEMTTNIQSIKQRIINQSASVSETNATMEQITQNIKKLDKNVTYQSENISGSGSAIEEMVANIKSVTETLKRNGGNVKTLLESSNIGRTGLQDVASDIQEIARESEGLLEINSVMENIASQTNLLSMNAAIEAAHAGEAGKGFAVVADEIRKLAESSSEQSKTIGTVLKKIKESIDKITQSTANVLNKFEAIDASVKIVAEQEENIRASMEEQEIGSLQILKGVGIVTEITKDIEAGSSEMLTGSSEVIREAQNLEKATQEITAGINEMATGADQINIAVHEVNEISVKNKDIITAVFTDVSKFKL